ncbi:MAG: HAMP domain-containing protein, partial [Parvularculaceae bacterium]
MKYIDDVKLSIKVPAAIGLLVIAAAGFTHFFGFTIPGLIGIALACAASYFLVRDVTNPLQSIRTVVARIAAGEFEGEASAYKAPSRGDEIGEVGKAVNDLFDNLKGKRDQSEAAAWESRFKSSAFQSASNAMMTIDRDFVVIYANEATKTLLTKHLDVFRTKWPSFDPDKIIGSCIDMFHKNPEHQRRMLADMSRLPYTTDIS